MSFNNAHMKLLCLWNVVEFPDNGPDSDIWLNDPQRTRRHVEQRASDRGRGMYTGTVQKWAYALFQRCREYESNNASSLRDRLIAVAEEPAKQKRPLLCGGKEFSANELINQLFEFKPNNAFKYSYAKKSEPLTWSEYTWFQILDDKFSLEHFNLLFVVNVSNKAICASESNMPSPKQIEYDQQMTSDLELINRKWHPRFESDSPRIEKLEGKYFLYRIYFSNSRIKGEPEKLNSEYGWFGDHRVEVVSVKMQKEHNCLKWEDRTPDPENFLYESVAYVVEQDDQFEIYGIDRERPQGGKFFGRCRLLRGDGKTWGAILARDRQTSELEAYRFWLQKVRNEEFEEFNAHVDHLTEELKDPSYTYEQKCKLFLTDNRILPPVAALLDRNERELVHYLFSPRGMTFDDLVDKEKVRALDANSVFRGVKDLWHVS